MIDFIVKSNLPTYKFSQFYFYYSLATPVLAAAPDILVAYLISMFVFSIITSTHFPHYFFLIFHNYFLVITLVYHLLFLPYEVSSISYYLLFSMLCCSLMVAIECFLPILLFFYFTTFYYYFLFELPVLAAAPDNPPVMPSILSISIIYLVSTTYLFLI